MDDSEDGTTDGHQRSNEKQFAQFFEEIHTEFLKFGDLQQLKVCQNFAPHLRGNVYVQFKNTDDAIRCYAVMSGRDSLGKKLQCRFVPITNWDAAICSEFKRGRCPKGDLCCFLHVLQNPNHEYGNNSDPRLMSAALQCQIPQILPGQQMYRQPHR